MTRDFARKQIGRMESLAFFPRTAEGIGELIDTLMDRCQSEDEAKAVIDECCEWEECPAPADISRVAHNQRKQAEEAAPKVVKHCPLCGDSGYIVTRRMVKLKSGAEYEAECADPCSCRGAA